MTSKSLVGLAVFALVGCGSTTSADPAVHTTSTSAAAQAETSSSATPDATPKPATSVTASPSATAKTSSPTSQPPRTKPSGTVSHDPKLRQVSVKWITFDVAAGWTAQTRENPGKFPDVKLTDTKTGATSQLVPVADIRMKGESVPDSNMAMCATLVRQRSQLFKQGWKQGPHKPLLIHPDKGYGYSCGIQGVLAKGDLANQPVDCIITSVANKKGQAVVQINVFPTKMDEAQAKRVGPAASQMLRQALDNWWASAP